MPLSDQIILGHFTMKKDHWSSLLGTWEKRIKLYNIQLHCIIHKTYLSSGFVLPNWNIILVTDKKCIAAF